MLKEDLARNVTLCLHNSFCRIRESNVDPLPCCKQRVEEQKCWRTASNSVRIANDVMQESHYHRRRKWNIDEWPKNEMQKETKLEEFRSFRTSKRRKKKKTKE